MPPVSLIIIPKLIGNIILAFCIHRKGISIDGKLLNYLKPQINLIRLFLCGYNYVKGSV